MRIVHEIARLNVGGAALSLLELAAGQRADGHDVLVVAGAIPPGESSMEALATELDVPYLHTPLLGRELSPRRDVAATGFMRRLIRERRPDVLHTHTSKAGATGRLAALAAGRARPAAVVHTFHGHVLSGYFDPTRELAFRLAERALAHATDRIIAVSEEVRDDLLRFHVASREKIAVVRYGFALERRVVGADEAARAAQREQIGARTDDFVIGWAGRLSDIKRPLDLVRVAELVPDSLLVLAGDGPLRPAVERLAGERGLADRVRLLGYVDDLGRRYAAFDAFLLTSANEGSPVVAIEALAAGVPVVATDAGGTRTVVDHGETGYLAPVGDVAALAAALRRLRADPSLRTELGRLGASRMRDRFSVERMIAATERVYTEALER